MDERLQKALEFSNYNLTISNQKKNVKNRVNQLRIVHSNGGVFMAEPATISFLKTLVDLGNKEGILIDSKDNPIHISNFEELLDKLVSAYFTATNELEAEHAKMKKMRNIKKIMDW